MRRAFGLYYLAVNSYSFGLAFMWNGIHTIILPAVLLLWVPESLKGTALGAMTFVGLVLAMLIQPISGALSDHTRLAWGRRRPWMIVGAAGSLVSLLIFGAAYTYALLALGYLLLQVMSNIAHGPFQGLIPDLIPSRRRGSASGVKNVLDIAGLLSGVLIAGHVIDRGQNWLAIVAIILALTITLLVSLFGFRERAAAGPRQARMPLSPGAIRETLTNAYRLDYRRYPSYAWLLVGRFLVMAGIYAVQGFAQYFIRDVLLSPNPAGATARLMAIVAGGTALLAYPAGRASDRFGRKAWNVMAAVVCSIGIFLLLTVRSYGALYLAGAVLGVGLGSFVSVNWALATDLVPQEEAGKYLGLSNLATAGAGATARLIGPAIDLFNVRRPGQGYTVLFVLAGCLILAGASVLWLKVEEPPRRAEGS